MEVNMSQPKPLEIFAQFLKKVPGPRSKAWTVLTNMALSLAQLLKRGERTLREVRERCFGNPTPIAKKLGWEK